METSTIEAQQNELEVLKSIFENDLVVIPGNSIHIKIRIVPHTGMPLFNDEQSSPSFSSTPIHHQPYSTNKTTAASTSPPNHNSQITSKSPDEYLNHVAVLLDVVLPKNYPQVPPHLKLEKIKGLSDDQLCSLEKKMRETAKKLVGNVMIHNVTEIVQEYLQVHNYRRVSFHEEMIERKTKQELEFQQRLLEEEEEEAEEDESHNTRIYSYI